MNMTAQKRHMEWAKQVDDWQSSGMSQREWCQMHGLSYEVFKYRKRCVEDLAAQLVSNGSGEITPVPAEITGSDSLQRYPSTVFGRQIMRIDLEHATISITNKADPQLLKAALEVLKDA